MIVRELVTKLNFKVDTKKLAQYESALKKVILFQEEANRKFIGGMRAGANFTKQGTAAIKEQTAALRELAAESKKRKPKAAGGGGKGGGGGFGAA